MDVVFNHNLCQKFSRLKKQGFDDAKALDKMGIKNKWLAKKLLAWYEAKIARELFLEQKYELAQKYIELKNTGIDAGQALDSLGLQGYERRMLFHFISRHSKKLSKVKKPHIQEFNYSEDDARDYQEIISKINQVGGQNRTPEWIIKSYGVTAYTAGKVWRKLNGN